MKMELWRVALEEREEETWLKLPTSCGANEYILMPGVVRGSFMMLTQDAFEAFRKTCVSSSPYGLRAARAVLAASVFAEVEEGCVAVPLALLRGGEIEGEELWCVKEEGKDIYHMTMESALGALLSNLERRIKE